MTTTGDTRKTHQVIHTVVKNQLKPGRPLHLVVVCVCAQVGTRGIHSEHDVDKKSEKKAQKHGYGAYT